MALLSALLVSFVIFLSSSSLTHQQVVGFQNFNVLKFGAVGDGKTDDTRAFMAAWTAVCGAAGSGASFIIPSRKMFLVQPVKFQGPCKSSSIRFQVNGNLVAPHFHQWIDKGVQGWIFFSDVSGLVISGTGVFHGRGADWWRIVKNTNKDYARPTSLLIINCNNLKLTGLSLKDSPRSHVSIVGTNVGTVSHLTITAPGESFNTDGIHISQSRNVQVHDSVIATGDDCVAIGGQSSYINVTNIACGPGHGISIGSLGQGGAEDNVRDVHVLHCSFSRTLYGARIKTWQGGSGNARSISFRNITLNEAHNPILIDQYYCGHYSGKCGYQPKAVRVSNVIFDGFRGTSSTEEAVQLNCSSAVGYGCTGIVLSNIDIKPANGQIQKVCSTCINAHGISKAISPAVNCLSR